MKKKIKMILSIIMVLFIIQYFIYKKNTNDIEKINFNDIQSIKIIEFGIENYKIAAIEL